MNQFIGPVLEVCQKTQMTLQEEGTLGKAVGGPGAIGAKGGELDPQEGMEPLTYGDLLGPEDFLEEIGCPPLWDPLPLLDWGYPQVFNANLSTIGMENSLHYFGESLNHVMQFQQNVNRKMVEHLNMTVKNQELQGKALGQLVEILGSESLISCLTLFLYMMGRTLKNLNLG